MTALLMIAGLLLSLLPLAEAHASHSGDAPLFAVSGAADCGAHLVRRSAPDVRSHDAIVIIGDEGPTGFILGRDPVTGEPIPRSGAGITAGSGTQNDPYIIEGWLIEQAQNAILLRDTTAHVIVRANRFAHHASHALSLQNAANVVVTGNVIETNVGSGVHVEGPATNVLLADNALYNNQRGLSLVRADTLVATRNAVLESRGIGIELDVTSDARIEGNVVDLPSAEGINIEGSPGSHVTCNRVTNGRGVGIYLGRQSSDSTVVGNRVDNHGYGIMLSSSAGTEVRGNHVSRSTGSTESTNIFVYESHDVVVADNELAVGSFGIVIRRSYDNFVQANRVTAHTWGVFCTGNSAGGTSASPKGALRNRFIANTFDDHQRGIMLRECDGTTVANNVLDHQTYDGIHDFESVNNTFRENTIANAPRAAIYLWRKGGHHVVGNRIRHSEDGIRVTDSSNNVIAGNDLEDNRFAVITRGESLDNQVSGNHVIASTGAGVYLFQGADAVVTRNNVLHNAVGVVVGSGYRGGRVEDNDIRDSAQAGLIVQREAPVDAASNWWGCAEGPAHADCDSVQGNAAVEPWRTSPVPGVSRPPVIEPLADRVVPVGTPLQVIVEASHPDRDPFALSAHGLPDGASFDSESGAFHWTPTPDDSSSHVVTFTADDGTDLAHQTLTILVPPEPSGPVTKDDTATVDRGSDVAIDVLANDAFPDTPPDWSRFRLLTEPRAPHKAVIERSDAGYPIVRFSAGRGASDSRFDYEMCDLAGRCAGARVVVTVH